MPETRDHYAKVELDTERALSIRSFDECAQPLFMPRWITPYLEPMPNHIYINFNMPVSNHNTHYFYIPHDTIIENPYNSITLETGTASYRLASGVKAEFRKLRLGDMDIRPDMKFIADPETTFVLEPDTTLIFTDCVISGHINSSVITVCADTENNTVGDIHIIFQGCQIKDDSVEDFINLYPNSLDENLSGSIHIIFDDTEYATKRQVVQYKQNYPNVSIRVDTCASPAEDLKTSE